MVAFLEKSTGSAGFHQIIDFLNRCHICYALTKKPEVCVSFIKQFWRSAETSIDDNGEVKINATIDGHSLSITEGSLRRHLKLADQDGITSIPNSEIFEQLALMGYHTDSDKLTFQKGAFSPQWRISSFTFPQPSSSHSPEPSTQHSPNYTTAAPTQPSPTQPTQPSPGAEHHFPTPEAEHHFPTPYDSPLHAVHSHGSDEGNLKLNELTNLVTKLSDRIGVLEDDLRKTKKTYSSAFTKLILRVKKLESQIKTGKTRRNARIVHSDAEDIEDDSSKQGMKLSAAEVQEKASTETEPFIQEVTPTEVIQDQENSEKGSAEVSTAGATKGTASDIPVVSTAEEISTAGRTVTYTRRSAEKRTRQDKGKAIMIESEPKKKSKKELEQERLSFAEAIRLEEQMNEEQRAQIARDEEIARQWDKEERQRAMSEVKSTKKIDWNDPSVIRYHALKMKPKTVAQARRNMIKYLKNQGNYKISDFKGMSYNEIRPMTYLCASCFGKSMLSFVILNKEQPGYYSAETILGGLQIGIKSLGYREPGQLSGGRSDIGHRSRWTPIMLEVPIYAYILALRPVYRSSTSDDEVFPAEERQLLLMTHLSYQSTGWIHADYLLTEEKDDEESNDDDDDAEEGALAPAETAAVAYSD
ncbi:hypothetical protein Tco_0213494 [Tanacetum coccineum]